MMNLIFFMVLQRGEYMQHFLHLFDYIIFLDHNVEIVKMGMNIHKEAVSGSNCYFLPL